MSTISENPLYEHLNLKSVTENTSEIDKPSI